ncbi:FLAVIN MONOAMINE OXIDASE [Salix purpurea]|uniref:FLAVIN MONOAMINE OXIDASE n=1 Tax=Salix purpurea TaxID=77065 RepID=A0A9Q0PAF5_SALPP|nr:FLAVIN MONOAMINE OXIDASE [Salix purpurea]
METTAEPPQEPSDNANDVVSEDSSPETDLNDHQNSPETNLPPSSETQSPLPNTTLDAPVSDSQDDSSDPIQPPQNPNSTFPAPPPKKRRRRKRFFTEINGNPPFRRHRIGGLAGLVAARQLMAMGFKVVVLEGRARPGGRVKTMKMKGEGVVAAADLELAKDLPIFYEKTVESIRYGVDGVIVYAGGQGFRGDMVLCTVPLGVLKKGSIEFVPELPQRKKDAIQRLGYGLLNKVALLFPYNFWGGEIDTFGHLKEDPSMRGEFFLFYSYSSVSGGALLIALVAGDAAVKFERMSPVESVKRVLSILRGIFHPKGIVVPDPVQSVCTRWGKDCFTYGSYSYVAVGSSGDDYDILAESVGDGRVFFAGEATNKQYPATMHGAFLSGMREAANILRVANRRSLSVTDKGNNGLEENDDLNELYDTPNLKFGSFSILFDPRSNDGESFSLLRVKFQGGESDSCVLSLYGLISRKQAVELSELQDDGKRMEMLYNNFQIRLVGRKGLPNAGESLLTYIKEARSKLNLGN